MRAGEAMDVCFGRLCLAVKAQAGGVVYNRIELGTRRGTGGRVHSVPMCVAFCGIVDAEATFGLTVRRTNCLTVRSSTSFNNMRAESYWRAASGTGMASYRRNAWDGTDTQHPGP